MASEAGVATRLSALEAENAKLKAKIQRLSSLEQKVAELTERVNTLEGGEEKSPAAKRSASKAKKTKTNGSSPDTPRTASKAALGKKKKKKTKTKPKSNEPDQGLKKRLVKKVIDQDHSDIPENRKGHYHVGKTKIYYVLPEEYAAKRDQKAEAPKASLELHLARGFNGKNCTNNLYYAKSGAIIYCIAGTGVVWDPKTNNQVLFTKHNEDISCLAVHPTEPIIATGQLDPKGAQTPFICIWTEDGKLIRTISYHDRAVKALAFSPDGQYLASIGDEDTQDIAIWDWQKKEEKESGSSVPLYAVGASKEPLEGCSFSPVPLDDKAKTNKAHAKGSCTVVVWGSKAFKVISFAGLHKKDKKERVSVIKAPSTYGASKIIQKAFHGVHYAATSQLKQSPGIDASKLSDEWFLGTSSGHVYKMRGTDFVGMEVAHQKKAVRDLCACDDGLAAICSDGKIVVFDPNLKKIQTIKTSDVDSPSSFTYRGGTFLVGTAKNQMFSVDRKTNATTMLVDGHSAETWGVACSPDGSLLATVAEDRLFKLWDAATESKRASLIAKATLKLSSKARSVAFSPDGATAVVGQWNGKIALIDVASVSLKGKERKIADETVDCVTFSPDGSLIAAGSWDQCVYILDAATGKVKSKMKGHSSSVLHIHFSDDGQFLMTSSRDYENLFWNVKKHKRVAHLSEVMDARFSNWTNFLGWSVQGIWEGASDGTDINTVASSPDGNLLAAGDDFGKVRLYAYPTLSENAPRKDYTGHSSHVTCVRWHPSGSRVYSAGGADCGVFQWTVK